MKNWGTSFLNRIKIIIEKQVPVGELTDENIIDKIFEPFFTSKPIGEGTGLGLSLCRSMAHQMGGDIEYKRENHLSIFELSLPVLS